MTFLITGTRKGIGKDLTLHYLGCGHQVVGCSRGLSSITHDRYLHFQLDVANERAVVDAVRRTERECGPLQVLINNAGKASMNHLSVTPMRTVDSLFSTNVTGTWVFLREAAKAMARRRWGRIVNFSSVAVPLNLTGEAVYAATKAAVESLTRVAAKEFGAWGITVNAVGPTPVRTDLIKGVPREKLDALLAEQAVPRFGEIKDILNVIDFFVREESNFITGQVIYLGGVAG